MECPEPPVESLHTTELLRRLSPGEIRRAHQILLREFSGDANAADANARRSRIALIGLRGAGKSTLGAKLAARLSVPFIELDRVIERESGVPLSVIFDLYGQSGFPPPRAAVPGANSRAPSAFRPFDGRKSRVGTRDI